MCVWVWLSVCGCGWVLGCRVWVNVQILHVHAYVNFSECLSYYLSSCLFFNPKVLRVLQELKQPLQSVENLDDPKYLNALHTLYSITLTQAGEIEIQFFVWVELDPMLLYSTGRHCVASIISMEDCSAILLPFIKPTGANMLFAYQY